jgi:hypothetical protein
MPGVPPRPPYSVGHSMPEKPAAVLAASQSRRIRKDSSSSTDFQKPGSVHSAGMLSASQVRSSARNCSSSAV